VSAWNVAATMGNWLWGKPKPQVVPGPVVTATDRAVLELKRQRDRLKQLSKLAEKTIAEEVKVAKELLKKGDKRRAMLALKKKKAQEQQIEKAEGMLMNLEEMVQKIVTAQQEIDVFKALEQGKNTLQSLNDQIKIEDVEKLMEDTAEAIAYQEELDQALSGQLGNIDEATLEAELAEIEEEEAAREVSALEVPSRPLAQDEVPVEPVKAKSRRPVESKTAVVVHT